MALTPDTPDEPNQAFLREVDENLRRDQLQSFAKTYGKWLIAALILFLAAVGGYLYWQQKQIEKSQAQSEELTKIYEQIGSGGAEGAKAVGVLLAKKAMAKNIGAVVFDRSGYLYHGRLKALAEGAREGGLKF